MRSTKTVHPRVRGGFLMLPLGALMACSASAAESGEYAPKAFGEVPVNSAQLQVFGGSVSEDDNQEGLVHPEPLVVVNATNPRVVEGGFEYTYRESGDVDHDFFKPQTDGRALLEHGKAVLRYLLETRGTTGWCGTGEYPNSVYHSKAPRDFAPNHIRIWLNPQNETRINTYQHALAFTSSKPGSASGDASGHSHEEHKHEEHDSESSGSFHDHSHGDDTFWVAPPTLHEVLANTGHMIFNCAGVAHASIKSDPIRPMKEALADLMVLLSPLTSDWMLVKDRASYAIQEGDEPKVRPLRNVADPSDVETNQFPVKPSMRQYATTSADRARATIFTHAFYAACHPDSQLTGRAAGEQSCDPNFKAKLNELLWTLVRHPPSVLTQHTNQSATITPSFGFNETPAQLEQKARVLYEGLASELVRRAQCFAERQDHGFLRNDVQRLKAGFQRVDLAISEPEDSACEVRADF